MLDGLALHALHGETGNGATLCRRGQARLQNNTGFFYPGSIPPTKASNKTVPSARFPGAYLKTIKCSACRISFLMLAYAELVDSLEMFFVADGFLVFLSGFTKESI
jgi:hypothetical protein